MDIEKEFLDRKIILVVAGGEYYGDMLDSLKQLSGKSICYVTLNKTYNALRKDFEKNNIDAKNIMIVDAISKSIKPVQNVEKNCVFVDSPGALTDLSIAIKKREESLNLPEEWLNKLEDIFNQIENMPDVKIKNSKESEKIKSLLEKLKKIIGEHTKALS